MTSIFRNPSFVNALRGTRCRPVVCTAKVSRLWPAAHLPHRAFTFSAPRQARYVRFSPDPENPWDVRKWNLGTKLVASLVVLSTGYYLYHLEQVPETGRWRFMDTSPAMETKLAERVRRAIEEEYHDRMLPETHPTTRYVKRVVSQLLEANDLGTLQSDNTEFTHVPGDESWDPDSWRLKGTKTETEPKREWTVFVVDADETVNAAANMSTIVVFTGILRTVCKEDEGKLAAVLSHEIAHVVARHSAEQRSMYKIVVSLGYLLEAIGLEVGISKLIVNLLYKLPVSREAELEADHIGLKIASKACYDPISTIELQISLARASKRLPVDFLDTHPLGTKRIKALQALLPMAYSIRAQTPGCAGLSDQVHAFQSASGAFAPAAAAPGGGTSEEETWS